MSNLKKKRLRKAVFPHLAAFVAATVESRRARGSRAVIRVMRQFHLYDKVPKKIFWRFD